MGPFADYFDLVKPFLQLEDPHTDMWWTTGEWEYWSEQECYPKEFRDLVSAQRTCKAASTIPREELLRRKLRWDVQMWW